MVVRSDTDAYGEVSDIVDVKVHTDKAIRADDPQRE